MKIDDVRKNAFAMPLNNPSYPRPPYKFYNREFVVITYRTDPEVLRAVVPEPLEVVGDTVAYEFIRMPDSTGFGDYTETGQVIPVRFKDKPTARCRKAATCTPCISTTIRRSPAAARSGASRKSSRRRRSATSTRRWSARCTTARCSASTPPWGTSTARLDHAPLIKALAKPAFMIKIMPHVDCTPRICELVRYYCEDVTAEGRLVRSGRAAVVRSCHVRRLAPAGAGSRLRQPLRHRPHSGSRRGGVRLPRK
jgi:acetoacetate decarboxylase